MKTSHLLLEERNHDSSGDEPPPELEPFAASSRPSSSTGAAATMRTSTASNNSTATVVLQDSTASSAGAALGQQVLAEDNPTIVAHSEVSAPSASRGPRKSSVTPGSFSGSSSTSAGSEQAVPTVRCSSTNQPNLEGTVAASNHVGSIQGAGARNQELVAAVGGSSVSGSRG